MFDFTQVAGLAFWLGTIFLAILLLVFGIEKWVKKIAAYDPEKAPVFTYFRGYITVTLMVVFALIVIYNTGGWVASSHDVQLNASANPDPRFLEAQKRDAQALTPKTRDELVREREAAAREKEQANQERTLQTDKKIEESMEDFRQRIMNRDAADKGTSGSGQTPSGNGK